MWGLLPDSPIIFYLSNEVKSKSDDLEYPKRRDSWQALYMLEGRVFYVDRHWLKNCSLERMAKLCSRLIEKCIGYPSTMMIN